MSLAYSFEVSALHWQDTPDFHERLIVDYDNAVAAEPRLAEHRKWVEENQFGFGHRAFHRVWHLLAKTLPDNFKFLEIGVHRGQSLSAVDLAAQIENKKCTVYGISPFDGAEDKVGGRFERKDYLPDIELIFSKWNGSNRPVLWKGFSQDDNIKSLARDNGLYDAVYIDGDHSLAGVRQDIMFYSPLVKKGGYLIADDAAWNLNMFKWAFKGFQGCSDAYDEKLPPKTANPDWQHITAVMHLRVWRKL